MLVVALLRQARKTLVLIGGCKGLKVNLLGLAMDGLTVIA